MKIIINIDKNVSETEITINCNQLTDEIENIMATLRIMNQQRASTATACSENNTNGRSCDMMYSR